VAVRDELNTAADAIVIIQVSRIERGKGHIEHLHALARLRDKPRWTCWMVGGAQRRSEVAYMNRLRRLAADLGINGRVRFLGERTDVPRLLAAADVYCQPNTRPEGFGLTFAEALHARLPVVTTDIGGAAELLDPDCALLIPSDAVAGPALSGALAQLIDSDELRHRLGAGAATRAAGLMDVRSEIAALRELLDDVVSSGATSISGAAS
jgi:glycosyltransferase involved in cell wall biosynthesis